MGKALYQKLLGKGHFLILQREMQAGRKLHLQEFSKTEIETQSSRAQNGSS